MKKCKCERDIVNYICTDKNCKDFDSEFRCFCMTCYEEKKLHPYPCSRDQILSVVKNYFKSWHLLKIRSNKLKEAAGKWKKNHPGLLNIYSPNDASVIFTASTEAEKLDDDIQKFHDTTVSALE